jgi:hypothetical protein
LKKIYFVLVQTLFINDYYFFNTFKIIYASIIYNYDILSKKFLSNYYYICRIIPPPISLNKLKYLKYKKKYLRLKNLQYGGQSWFQKTINRLRRGLLYLSVAIVGAGIAVGGLILGAGAGSVLAILGTGKILYEIYKNPDWGTVYPNTPSPDLLQTAGSFNTNTHNKTTDITNILTDLKDVDNISLAFQGIINKYIGERLKTPQITKLKTEIDTLLNIIDSVNQNKQNIKEDYITTLQTIFDKLNELIKIENNQIRTIYIQLFNVINSSKQPNIVKSKEVLLQKINFIKTSLITITEIPKFTLIQKLKVKSTPSDTQSKDTKDKLDTERKLATIINTLNEISTKYNIYK